MFMKTYTVTYGFDVGTRVHCTMVDSLLVALAEDDWSHSSAQLAADEVLVQRGTDGYHGLHRIIEGFAIASGEDDPSAIESPGHSYVVHHNDGRFSVRVFDPRHSGEKGANDFALKMAKHEAIGVDGKVL
jgi:hypothetical protein